MLMLFRRIATVTSDCGFTPITGPIIVESKTDQSHRLI